MFTRDDLVKGFSNVGWLLTGNYASQALSLVTMLVIARRLGPAAFGTLSTATAFVGLFAVFHLAGFDTVFVRESVARPRSQDELYSRLLGLKLVSGLLGMFACGVAVLVSGLDSQERALVWIFGLTLMTQAVSSLATSVLQSHEDMRWMTIGNLGRQSFYIVIAGAGLWWAWFPTQRVGFVMCVLTASYAAVMAFYLSAVRRYIPNPLRVRSPRFERAFLKAGIVFSVSGILVFLYTKVDILMIRAFMSAADVGYYSACMSITDRITSPVRVMLTAFFPAAVRRMHEAQRADLGYIRRISLGFGLAGALVAGLGTLLAPMLIPLALGADFAGAVAPMRVLLWSMVPTIAMMPYVTAVQVSRHEDLILRLVPLRAALNVTLNYVFLANGWGIVGVATGSVITSSLFNMVFLFFAHGRLKKGFGVGGGVSA